MNGHFASLDICFPLRLSTTNITAVNVTAVPTEAGYLDFSVVRGACRRSRPVANTFSVSW